MTNRGIRADVFLSYSSADRSKAEAVQAALESLGFAVFRDHSTPPGTDWDSWIRGHLTDAKCVLVLWSKTAVASNNVRHEAALAHNAGKLVPALIDKLSAADFPMGFYSLQAADLTKWKPGSEFAAFDSLVRELSRRTGVRPAPALREVSRHPQRKRWQGIALIAGGSIALAIAAWVVSSVWQSPGVASSGPAAVAAKPEPLKEIAAGEVGGQLYADGITISRPGDMVIGKDTAVATLVEYGSATCGHCAKFRNDVARSVVSRFVESGQLQFVFREVATPPKDVAIALFQVARCGAQSSQIYMDRLDIAYARQSAILASLPRDGGLEEVLDVARVAGLTDEQAKACIAHPDAGKRIEKMEQQATSDFQVTYTPAFVLNNERLPDDVSKDSFEFQAAVEHAIATSSARRNAEVVQGH